jgi:hypothetical protein
MRNSFLKKGGLWARYVSMYIFNVTSLILNCDNQILCSL